MCSPVAPRYGCHAPQRPARVSGRVIERQIACLNKGDLPELAASDELPTLSDMQPIDLNSAALGIGRHVSGIADPFNGHIDEFRIAHVQRSDGWIETTWNNMSDPGEFAGGREAGRRRAATACRRWCGRLPDGVSPTDRSADQRSIRWRINQAPVQVGHFQHRRSHTIPHVRHHAEPASPGKRWRSRSSSRRPSRS